jgi:hypothetical protein
MRNLPERHHFPCQSKENRMPTPTLPPAVGCLSRSPSSRHWPEPLCWPGTVVVTKVVPGSNYRQALDGEDARNCGDHAGGARITSADRHRAPASSGRPNGAHLAEVARLLVHSRARRLRGVSGCEVSTAGVYSAHAKGDLRCDQRTHPDAPAGPGGADPASSRNSPASDGGSVVPKQRSDHHHAEQKPIFLEQLAHI